MKIKKLTAVFLAAVISVTALVCGMIDAYAETVTLDDAKFGMEIVKSTSGYDDNVWYVYTPSQSGVYTLYGLASNLYATEAYLFEKTEDENGKKLYTQLAYSNSNPDYENYDGAAKRQFCLKYHLVEGVTYYYAAGWNSETRSGAISVTFINESYDSANLVSIVPSCNAALTWYTDGSWETDDSGNPYYLYNISRIIQNMSLTITFDDGTTLTSSAGDSTVGGYPITYTHHQQSVHWYNENDEEYTANTLTITVLGMSVNYEVDIEQGALFTVKGKVVDDTDGAAVSGAQLVIGNSVVASTSDDGTFSFAYSPGTYNVTVRGSGVVEREFTLNVDAMVSANNDHTSTPVSVVCGDYIADNIINGRDLAYIMRNLNGDEFTAAQTAFSQHIGFESSHYEKLVL